MRVELSLASRQRTEVDSVEVCRQDIGRRRPRLRARRPGLPRNVEHRTFEGYDHLTHGDTVGRPGERAPARSSAPASDDARARQGAHLLLCEAARQPHRSALGRPPPRSRPAAASQAAPASAGRSRVAARHASTRAPPTAGCSDSARRSSTPPSPRACRRTPHGRRAAAPRRRSPRSRYRQGSPPRQRDGGPSRSPPRRSRAPRHRAPTGPGCRERSSRRFPG